MPLALFGITNDGLNLAVNLLVLFLVVLYIALIVWTYLDARRRLDDQVLVAAATVASLFLFVGTIVYSILRFSEFLADKRERELETRASELRVRQLEEQSCQNCGFPIERTYLRCPNCRSRVKDPCASCGKPVDPRWSLCPYCEQPVRRAAAPPASSGRRKAPRAASGTAHRRKPAEDRAPATGQAKRPPARPGSSQRPPRAAKQRPAPKPRPVSDGDSAPRRTESADAPGEDRPKPAAT